MTGLRKDAASRDIRSGSVRSYAFEMTTEIHVMMRGAACRVLLGQEEDAAKLRPVFE
jgi:hypothetical protein